METQCHFVDATEKCFNYSATAFTHFPYTLCNYEQDMLPLFPAKPWLNTSHIWQFIWKCDLKLNHSVWYSAQAHGTELKHFFVQLNDSAAIRWTLGVYHRCPGIAQENDTIKTEQGWKMPNDRCAKMESKKSKPPLQPELQVAYTFDNSPIVQMSRIQEKGELWGSAQTSVLF